MAKKTYRYLRWSQSRTNRGNQDEFLKRYENFEIISFKRVIRNHKYFTRILAVEKEVYRNQGVTIFKYRAGSIEARIWKFGKPESATEIRNEFVTFMSLIGNLNSSLTGISIRNFVEAWLGSIGVEIQKIERDRQKIGTWFGVFIDGTVNKEYFFIRESGVWRPAKRFEVDSGDINRI